MLEQFHRNLDALAALLVVMIAIMIRLKNAEDVHPILLLLPMFVLLV